MAYDEELGARLRDVIAEIAEPDERKMFGGLAFMIDGHMCCGVIKEDLVLRLGQEAADVALTEPHVRPMDFTGKPMKGYVYVRQDGLPDEASIRRWVDQARAFVKTLPPKR